MEASGCQVESEAAEQIYDRGEGGGGGGVRGCEASACEGQ